MTSPILPEGLVIKITAPAHTAIEEIVRHFFTERLRNFQGNIGATARDLHVSRSTVYRYIEEYKIDVESFRNLTGP